MSEQIITGVFVDFETKETITRELTEQEKKAYLTALASQPVESVTK